MTWEAGSIDAARPPGRLLLVAAPMGAIDRPALGLSLLGAQATADGRPCTIRYLTFAFADLVGVDEYRWLVSGPPYEAMVGEWLFAEALYGPRPEIDERYLTDALPRRWGVTADSIARIRRARRCATHFVDACRSLVDWGDHEVVGFTSTFQQNLASLALAQAVKRDHPDVRIVFGGANWEGEMGVALLERFTFVDAACSGEADESLPPLLAAIDAGRRPDDVPGVVHRLDGQVATTGAAVAVHDLDGLAVPDFSAYFDALDRHPSALGLRPRLLFESARGCWWGAHRHCTFCGLNGSSMAFRSKSPRRVLDELRELHRRHGIPTVSVVDNILDMRYLRTVLPALEHDGPALDLFWEIKASLTQGQIRQLAAAGVRTVQPGVESLSDHVLELLDKGTTTLRNVALLKWGVEHGVRIEWNLLIGVPGEQQEDYDEMVPLLASLHHLDPPSACGPVRLDRFSPYHEDPAAHDMTEVRAMESYRYLYDVDPAELDRIAYYFDFAFADGRDPLAFAPPLLAAVARWQAGHAGAGFWAVERPDGALALVDQRTARRRSTVLGGWKAAVVRDADRARTLEELTAVGVAGGADAEAVAELLDRCVRLGVMITDGTRWLGLAVHSPARSAPRTRPAFELVAAGG